MIDWLCRHISGFGGVGLHDSVVRITIEYLSRTISHTFERA